MSMKRLGTGRWQVRWRDAAGTQRARNFAYKAQAQAFEDELRAARAGLLPEPVSDGVQQVCALTFADVVESWRHRRYPALATSTQETYDKLLRLHFAPLLPQRIADVTPAVLDGWMDWLLDNRDAHGKGRLRTTFRAELALLRAILNDYGEYADGWVSPVKGRHRKRIRVAPARAKRRDMTAEELGQMCEALRELNYHGRGAVFAVLATVQFWQALRISEPAALTWEGVRLNWAAPAKSRLVFTQHVVYLRATPSHIEAGIKNDSMKEQPILPETFIALAELWTPTASGLVFHDEEGQFLRYREVQYAYDRALKKAGLPFTATHVMRHGGTRTVLEDTGGDRDVAAQQLGNRDGKTVDVYAVRSAAAFTRYATAKWAECASQRAFEKAKMRIVK